MHPNAAQCIAHLQVLTQWSTFTVVSTKLTAILGEAPIECLAGAHLWLLDLLPADVAPKDLKLHSRPLLCESDASDEAEERFVESHGTGLFGVSVRVDGDGGKPAYRRRLVDSACFPRYGS